MPQQTKILIFDFVGWRACSIELFIVKRIGASGERWFIPMGPASMSAWPEIISCILHIDAVFKLKTF